jgi:hypothetical protein
MAGNVCVFRLVDRHGERGSQVRIASIRSNKGRHLMAGRLLKSPEGLIEGTYVRSNRSTCSGIWTIKRFGSTCGRIAAPNAASTVFDRIVGMRLTYGRA